MLARLTGWPNHFFWHPTRQAQIGGRLPKYAVTVICCKPLSPGLHGPQRTCIKEPVERHASAHVNSVDSTAA